MNLRALTREERTKVNRALDRWGTFEYFSDKTLIMDVESKKVCLTTPELWSVVGEVRPDLAGLAIGELKKTFTPTMPGADLFERNAKSDKYYVQVTENAAQLVLYGRDVMGDSIVSAWDGLDENELVILLTSRREAIGIGRTRYAGRSLLQKGKITITTVADAGLYLREEG